MRKRVLHSAKKDYFAKMSKNNEWWRGCVMYQVYPRSYSDANGDGVYSNGDPYDFDMDNPNSGYADMYLTWGGGNYTGWNPIQPSR